MWLRNILQNVTEHLWNQSTLFTQFIFVFSSERKEIFFRNKPNLDPGSKKLLIKRDPDPQPCLRVFKQWLKLIYQDRLEIILPAPLWNCAVWSRKLASQRCNQFPWRDQKQNRSRKHHVGVMMIETILLSNHGKAEANPCRL